MTYAIQGIAYFFTHPRLWLTAIYPLLYTLLFAIVSAVVIFAVALRPQARGLADAGVPNGLAWVLAVFLAIIEIFLATLIYSLIALPGYADRVFDMVLTDKGHGEVVHNKKIRASFGRTCSIWCRVNMSRQVLTLPLNLIPFVGTITYIWINGLLFGWEAHLYYFELKGYSYSEQKEVVDSHKRTYSSFGMQTLVSEMIPALGPLFLFTNAVGAALFAADLEAELRQSYACYKSVGDDKDNNNGNPRSTAYHTFQV
ncbi:hypothetical protein Poli38472_013718 [Pythium oligandrum]|uniref:Uncharacterized protein n=1 Tax=Pythium oligandrum TaxID=41045 RepID=A0A8K1CDN9_PYTOL|nr:hypothetical protein Poli38472_013718 [Pythium oligandrum]|eukprot:TMW61255.1 hypothetical protein Poli38472_013718 [Pythium oligandrum]